MNSDDKSSRIVKVTGLRKERITKAPNEYENWGVVYVMTGS